MYLADNRDRFLQLLRRKKCSHAHKSRRELLRLARPAFHLESDDVKQLYLQKVLGRSGVGAGRHRLRGKQAALAYDGFGKKALGRWGVGIVRRRLLWKQPGGIQASPGGVGVETLGGIQASQSAPTTPPVRCRSSPAGPSMSLHVLPDAQVSSSMPSKLWCRPSFSEAQAVGGGQHDSRTSPAPVKTVSDASTQTIAPDQLMLACGDVAHSRCRARGTFTAGRTPSWMQHFRIRGDSGPQAKVHSCIVSHIGDLRKIWGDIAAADVLGTSLRCLHRFQSFLKSDRQLRGKGQLRGKVVAATILGLAVKLVVNTEVTERIPVETCGQRLQAIGMFSV